MIMSHRIAEHPDVLLPVMICQDGFITSHAIENIIIEEDAAAQAFVGDYRPSKHLLNPSESLGIGPYSISAFYMEMKRKQFEAMNSARKVIDDVSKDFGKHMGRHYGMYEAYKMEDAELAVLLMSSAAGTGKDAVDALREKGIKAGLVKLRVFRPFPAKELATVFRKVKAVGIMDRSDGFSGNGGPIGAETRAALYGNADGIKTRNYLFGLGGRDVRVEDFHVIFGELQDMVDGKQLSDCRYVGVRE
jgi:pyruvate ferredoxin oxidoreductase alpha subunit